MSRKVRRSAIERAAEELQMDYPDTFIQGGVASFCDHRIALDFAARIIYSQELGVFEIISGQEGWLGGRGRRRATRGQGGRGGKYANNDATPGCGVRLHV